MGDSAASRPGVTPAQPSVTVHPDPDSLALATATLVVEEARRAVKMRGRFTVALAGGSTPKKAYELLGQPPFVELVPWNSVHVFWGDERCVDPADPRSNERLAREALLDRVPIPPEQVHPMMKSGVIPEHAASEYDALLHAFFPFGGDVGSASRNRAEGTETACDLILLGLGDNGHTASLFPGSEVLREEERWAAPVFVDAAAGAGTTAAGQDMWRITLTVPFINSAALVVFLVSGPSKAEVVEEVIEGRLDTLRLPAQLVRPANGRLCWYLDDDSASLLNRGSLE